VAAVEQICDRHTIEAQGYLDCQNILETLGRKNKQKLEAACQQLANMRGYATYSTIKRLMAAIESDQDKKAPVRAAASNRKNTQKPGADAADALVRGADYYRQGR
jgi:hypothetical protein